MAMHVGHTAVNVTQKKRAGYFYPARFALRIYSVVINPP